MRRLAAAVLLVTLLAACGTTTAPVPDVALAAPRAAAARPIDGAELTPGTTYRFADVLLEALDVEVTVGAPKVFSYSGGSFAYLTGDDMGTTDLVTFLAADDISQRSHPLKNSQYDDALDTQIAIDPGRVLAHIAGLSYLHVTVPERTLTIAGIPARAIDIDVPELPTETEPCAAGAPPCATLLVAAGFGQQGGFEQVVETGQALRIAQLDLPLGRLIIVQNLRDARAQALVDGSRFVEQRLPAELAPARPLPSTRDPLPPGTYGFVLGDVGVGVVASTGDTPTIAFHSSTSFVFLSADLPPDLRDPALFGYRASTEKLFGAVALSADLLVPEAGVDPRTVGPAAFDRSTGSATGVVDVIAAQPWAEVMTAPAASTVAGLPSRSVEVRLRPAAGSVPCTVSRPEAGSCAVLVYSRVFPTIWLISDRVLRVSDVAVGGQQLTVITSTDPPGTFFSDSLKLVGPRG